jgi:RNA polymerase sigma-70 factor (ECF subfamily)
MIDAEDAVAAAIATALSHWSEHPPKNPEAWLMTVAWRKALDQIRQRRRTVSLNDVQEDVEALPDLMDELESHLPYERLRLFFCVRILR